MGQSIVGLLKCLIRRFLSLSHRPYRLISCLWTALQSLFARLFRRNVTPPPPKPSVRDVAPRPRIGDVCNAPSMTHASNPARERDDHVVIMSSRAPDHAHSQYAPSIQVLSDSPQRTDSPVSQAVPSSASGGSIRVGVESPNESEWNESNYYDDMSVSGWHSRPRQQPPGSDYGSGGGRSVRSVAPNQTAIPGLGNAPSILVEGKQAIVPLNNSKVKPGVPEEYKRYDRGIVIPQKRFDHKIEPLTTNFLDNRADPPGWLSYIHPEGALYFFHTEKRIFTDANLFDPRTLSQVDDRLHIIYTHMEQQGISISKIGKNVDLVLDMIPVDGSPEMECYYYFVDHATRTIFYLDEVMTSLLPGWHTVSGLQALPHVRHEVESQYWYHCLLFPRAFDLDYDILEQFRDTVLFFISDQMSSPTSTSPFSIQELESILKMINNLQKNLGTQYGGCAAAIGRIMNQFARHRFHHFHGEPGARLDNQQSIHGFKFGQKSWLATCVSPLLFSAPDVHLRTLERIWVDQVMHQPSWQKFVDKLVKEWTEIVLYATVVLNANVAFLAIQSIDTDPDDPGYRNPAQISSYISTIISMGCVIIGLLLIRQKQTKIKVTVDDVIAFLKRRKLKAVGLEHLAIMYSLPYALLMWSMWFFVLSFTFVFFQDTTTETRALVGCACATIVVLTVWCIWMGWEKQSDYEPDDGDSEDQEEGQDSTNKSVGEKSLQGSSDVQSSNENAGSTTPAVESTKTHRLSFSMISSGFKALRLPWVSRVPPAPTSPMGDVENRV